MNKSLKRLSELLNNDLGNYTNRLNANKVTRNVWKIELNIFRPYKKLLDFDMKIKLNGKRLYTTDSVKYLRG